MRKKLIALVLSVLCVCSISNLSTAAATENLPIQPYYTGLAQVTVSLDILDTTLGALYADCYGFVALYDGYSADITMSLQRSSDKSDWSTIKSWETSGEEEIRISEGYFILVDYYYRVNILIYVYYPSGSIAEIISKYSPIRP